MPTSSDSSTTPEKTPESPHDYYDPNWRSPSRPGMLIFLAYCNFKMIIYNNFLILLWEILIFWDYCRKLCYFWITIIKLEFQRAEIPIRPVEILPQRKKRLRNPKSPNRKNLANPKGPNPRLIRKRGVCCSYSNLYFKNIVIFWKNDIFMEQFWTVKMPEIYRIRWNSSLLLWRKIYLLKYLNSKYSNVFQI